MSAPPRQPTSNAISAAAAAMAVPIAARGAEDHRRQPHHRADRQIDAARDDHRRQRHRQQPELDAERMISKKFPTVKKCGATAAKSAISTASATSRTVAVGMRAPPSMHARSRSHGMRRGPRRAGVDATAARMIAPWIARSQYALTPRNVSAGPIAPSSTTPSSVPAKRAAPAGDRGAADDDRRDDLHLETEAGVAGNLVEAHGIEHGGESRSARRRARTPNFTRAVSSPASRAASGWTRSRRSRGPPRDGEAPREHRRAARPPCRRHDGIRRLGESQPLKARRQVLHPGALRRPPHPPAARPSSPASPRSRECAHRRRARR